MLRLSRGFSGQRVASWACLGPWARATHRARRQLSQTYLVKSTRQNRDPEATTHAKVKRHQTTQELKDIPGPEECFASQTSQNLDSAHELLGIQRREQIGDANNRIRQKPGNFLAAESEKHIQQLSNPFQPRKPDQRRKSDHQRNPVQLKRSAQSRSSGRPSIDKEADSVFSKPTMREYSRSSAASQSTLQAALSPSAGDASLKSKDGLKRPKAGDSLERALKKKKGPPCPEHDMEGKRLVVKVIRPRNLRLMPIEEDTRTEVPSLSHNLDRVLFNQGVYQMQDDRSGVFNFDPYLASIMPIQEFDFDAIKDYITSSKDTKLRQLCAKHNLKYCGSTSSMTSILSHFHFLLSAWRSIYVGNLSQSLKPDSYNFTQITRAPAAAYARLENGIYAIDADKQYDTENVLSMLGKSMEKLLTLPKEEFEKYRKTKSHQIPDEEKNADESYHYTTMGDFLMRSQLDAQDPRLPGTGMFDLKTRAVISVRMDVQGYEKGVGYEIRRRFGQWESFEREYYDMIRSAFLKYSLQVRMGRMDGIFVAFHNTQRIFGFQYISLQEMDQAIHGTSDLRIGDQEYKSSIALLNEVMKRATARFPGRTLRLHVETRPTKVPLTYVFAEPVTEEEVERNQAARKPLAEKVVQEIRQTWESSSADRTQDGVALKLEQSQLEETDGPMDDAVSDEPQSDAAWKELMKKVEETVENESQGIGSVRGAIQGALEQSGLLQGLTELESDECLDEMVDVLTAHVREGKDSRDLLSQGGEHAQADEPESAFASDEPRADDVSLTDLIIRVAKTLDDERQNLKTFQRAFVDLATQSRKADPTQEHETSKTGCDDATASEADAANFEEGTNVREADGRVFVGRAKRKLPKEVVQGDTGRDTLTVPEIMGMYVTIRNQVNGEFVDRPETPGRQFDWSIQYAITELPLKRARKIYAEMKMRRRKALESDPGTKEAEWHQMFGGSLPAKTKKGEQYRKRRTQEEAGNPIYVAWHRDPLSPGTSRTTDLSASK